jgi:hypothetical protein
MDFTLTCGEGATPRYMERSNATCGGSLRFAPTGLQRDTIVDVEHRSIVVWLYGESVL